MKKTLVGLTWVVAAVSLSGTAFADATKGGKIDGKVEFEKHCSACHANGGNSMKPDKTLKKKDLQAHGLKTSQDIVKLMRNPGPGMTPFDKNTVSDKEAKAIAAYVLKAFK